MGTSDYLQIEPGAKIDKCNSEHKKILIVNGSCLLTLDEVTHYLKAGDFIDIPKDKKHFIEVTSIAPCKVLLERLSR